MAGLSAFLHPELPEEEDVIVSKRFVEDGKPVAFRVRPITQEENQQLIKQHTKVVKKGGLTERKLDSERYVNALIVAGTVFPDFRAKELCEAYGTLDPLQVPGKMLLAGEYQKLSDAIMSLSGLSDDAAEEEVEEAKNS